MARLFITLVLVAFSHVVAGEERTCNTVSGLEGCTCTDSETNEIVSLQGLVSNNTMVPRFKVETDTNWSFAYHPCGTFDMFLNVTDPNPGYYGCKGSTAARFESGAVKQCSGLGNLDGAMFKYDNNYIHPVVSNLTVTYRNKSSTAKQGAVISLICDRSLMMEDSLLEYINSTEGVEETYYLSLRSPCACPGGCEAKMSQTTQPPATNGSTTAVPSNATTTAKPTSVPGGESTCDTVSGLEGCACTDSDTNEIVSLQGLVSNNTMIPRFKVEADTNWNFAYHPCGTFDMFLNVTDPNPGYYGCKGSTAARYESGAVKQCSGLGNLDGAMFKYDNNFTYPVVSNFTVTYRNKSSTAKQGAVISLICDRSLTMENSTLEYINSTEGVEETYYMSLRSPCACPGGCEAKVPPTTQPPATNGSTTAVPSNATTTAKPSSGYWTVANTNVISVMLLVGLFVVGVVYAE